MDSYSMTGLNDLCTSLKQKSDYPGFLIQIHRGSKLIYSCYDGFANIEKQVPIQPNDLFRVGSVTKLMTSVVTLMLVEKGRLNLDAPIDTLLPKKWIKQFKYSEVITLRQLLGMRSSIHNYTDDSAYLEKIAKEMTYPWSLPELIQYGRNHSSSTYPGKEFSYSNTNYLLIQLIIEKATSRSFESNLQDYLIIPLKLKQTYLDNPYKEKRLEVHGYQYVENNKHGHWVDVTHHNDGRGFADGGVISTAQDLSTLMNALFIKKTLLKHSSLQSILELKATDNTNEFYGLGIVAIDVEGKKVYGHDGSIPGYKSYVFSEINKDYTFVALFNTDSFQFDPTPFLKEVLQLE